MSDTLTAFVVIVLGAPILCAVAAIVSGFIKGIMQFWREGPR